MDWEDMYENRQKKKMMMVDPKVKTLPIDLKLEVQSPLSLTEVTVNSKTKKKTMKLKTQIHWLAMVKKVRQKMREKPDIGI